MIALPVLLNFDLAREILKIRCQIYVLIKRVIIPSKIQVTIIFLQHHFPKNSVWAWTEEKLW